MDASRLALRIMYSGRLAASKMERAKQNGSRMEAPQPALVAAAAGQRRRQAEAATRLLSVGSWQQACPGSLSLVMLCSAEPLRTCGSAQQGVWLVD